MPEKSLTIAAYAAGASLAAVTLVYVFGPTFFLDDEAANSSRSSRKRGMVGLVNPANDCFINSILQALAGLPELRLYLIREMHRRRLDGPDMYRDLTAALEAEDRRRRDDKGGEQKPVPEWKLLGLQQGLVTAGLKDVLDALNERPIYKKTISAQAFIRVVEHAFRTRVSRSQQDAQEFLQVIAERLADEHYAGRRVRMAARQKRLSVEVLVSTDNGECKSLPAHDAAVDAPNSTSSNLDDSYVQDEVDAGVTKDEFPEKDFDEDEPAYPFEGKLESQVECSYCHFKPRPAISSFVSLTLHVPQTSNTTLNACFDGMLKVEHIDDFTCDRCRLEHALQVNQHRSTKAGLSDEDHAQLERDRARLQAALDEDPENPPPDLALPDLAAVPKRRISRHTRISSFPRILAIHLSRSVWDSSALSTKNSAKVSFAENMPLGGLIDRKHYRLLGVVTHKGEHNSGHYESFRRQFLSPPYSTPASMGTGGIYSLRSSPVPSPRIAPTRAGGSPPSLPQINDLPSVSASTSSSNQSSRGSAHTAHRKPAHPSTSIPIEAIPTPGLPTPPSSMEITTTPKRSGSISSAMHRVRRRATKGPDRWWRISDDKIKECKTSEVLGMRQEVYLLFYEMVDDPELVG